MLQQGQTLPPLLLQGVDEESQRFAGEHSRGEEVALRDEEVREDASARMVLQIPEELQETGRKLLESPHGVVEPDRRDTGGRRRQEIRTFLMNNWKINNDADRFQQ